MYFIPLAGDRYEIGFQHGHKLKDLIHYAIRERCRFFRDKGLLTPTALHRRANAVESSYPEIMEEMRGIAEGSQQSLDDILFYNLAPIHEGCTNVAFTDGCQPMLGHTNDQMWQVPDVAFYIKPNKGPEILHIGVAGSVGVGVAVNSDGLAVSHACARGVGGLVNSDACLNLPVLRRALIDRCGNCSEARDFLSAHCFTSGADNIVCADREGSAFVAEKLPTTVAFREPVGRGIHCTGRALTKEVRSAVGQDAYETDAAEISQLSAREKLFDGVLTQPEQTLSLHLMQQLLQNSDEGIEVSNKDTTWAAVLMPAEFEMWVADGIPCQSRFKRISRTKRGRFI